jgi:hypothetical protein
VYSEFGVDGGLDESLVNQLLAMVDEHNVVAKSFRRVRDCLEQTQNAKVALRLLRHRSTNERANNIPSMDEFAALIVGDFDSSDTGKDIILHSHNGQLQRLPEFHASYMPLQYPLLFPYGEDGFHEKIPLTKSYLDSSTRKRVRVSLREFIAFRIQERHIEHSIILRSRRLFQQFIVDSYSMIESQRLSFIKYNQRKIRSEFLSGIEEAVNRGDVKPASIGSRVVLPSSFTGGRRNIFNNCQDAMAICNKFGYPDLFLTMTCNPNWLEIQRFLHEKDMHANDRPDIACRVFHLKLNDMMADFKKGNFFGKVVASKF